MISCSTCLQDLRFTMAATAQKHMGPTANAVTASMLMTKLSRVTYRESAFPYSFPAPCTYEELPAAHAEVNSLHRSMHIMTKLPRVM